MRNINDPPSATPPMNSSVQPTPAITTVPPSPKKKSITKRPMKVRPRSRIFEAMRFDDFESLQYIIPWLGSSFYALTDGDPIAIEGHPVKSGKKKPEDAPLRNLLLIIYDPVTKSIMAVEPDFWIVHNKAEGFQFLTDEEFAARFVSVDDKE